MTFFSTEGNAQAKMEMLWRLNGPRELPNESGENQFEKLSDELFIKIFEELNENQIASCRLVARRWHQISCDPRLIAHIPQLADARHNKMLEDLMPNCPWAKDIYSREKYSFVLIPKTPTITLDQIARLTGVQNDQQNTDGNQGL